jgi:hypothetical protein
MSGTYTEAQVDAAVKHNVDDAHVFVYIPSPEALAITSGTEEKVTTFEENNLSPKKFTIVGGVITYTGTPDIEIKLSASMSITTIANNITATFYFAKNGVVDTKSAITRKIGTGSDEGAVSNEQPFTLSSGDTIELFADVSSSTTLTMQTCKMNCVLVEVL